MHNSLFKCVQYSTYFLQSKAQGEKHMTASL